MMVIANCEMERNNNNQDCSNQLSLVAAQQPNMMEDPVMEDCSYPILLHSAQAASFDGHSGSVAMCQMPPAATEQCHD